MHTAEEIDVDEQPWEEEAEEEEVCDASPGGEQQETFSTGPPGQVPDAWAGQNLGSPTATPGTSGDDINPNLSSADWRPTMWPGNFESRQHEQLRPQN